MLFWIKKVGECNKKQSLSVWSLSHPRGGTDTLRIQTGDYTISCTIFERVSHAQTPEKRYERQISPGVSYREREPCPRCLRRAPAFLCRVAESMYRLQSSDFLVHNRNMYMLGGPTIIFCKWQFVKYFLLKKIFKSEKLWLFRRSVLTIKKIIIPYKSRPRGNKCDISINVNGIFMF